MTIDTDRRRLDLDVVHGFLTTSYWAAGVSRDTVRAMIDGAACCVGAYDAAGRQVGFARVTSDRVRIAYLQDVFVVEAARGQGVGARLVEAALGAPALAAVPTWLLATRDAQGLYARYGFAPIEGPIQYMKRVRTPAAALPPPISPDVPFAMSAVAVSIRRLAHAEGLDLPAYATDGSAGMDLRAALPADAPVILAPGERAIVPTGLQIALPVGYEAQVRPRSGLAAKHGVTVLNSPGTIDADYRGEVRVILANLGREVFTIERGERIAQLVVAAHARVAWDEADALDATERGAGGFGSTGR